MKPEPGPPMTLGNAAIARVRGRNEAARVIDLRGAGAAAARSPGGGAGMLAEIRV